MARDLFRAIFERFTAFDWETYRSEFMEELPLHLLRAAGKSDPNLSGHQDFDSLCANMQAVSRDQWNNPELYPHLFGLLRQNGSIDHHLRCLNLQLGLEELLPGNFPAGFYRRRIPAPMLNKIEDGKVVDLSNVLVRHDISGPFPLVYLPHPGLFDDVVGPGNYDGSDHTLQKPHAERMIRQAAASLNRYSSELYEGFCEATGTVGLTGSPDAVDRSSYSSRMYYAGGIFSSLLRDNVPALVENLIHEYYHQRIWVWWSIEPPGDLPDEELTIISPVTKMRRSVRVMLHALLIYIGVSGYYRFALENDELSDQVATWARSRLNHLTRGSVELRDILLENLTSHQESLSFVKFMAELMVPSEVASH